MIVAKVGGSIVSEADAVASGLSRIGRELVVVHGYSYEVSRLMGEAGLEETFLTSASGHRSRHTTKEVMEVVIQGAQNVNDGLVAAFEKAGVAAVGVNGADVLEAKRKDAIKVRDGGKIKIIRDDYTGKVVSADAEHIRKIVGEGKVPVISVVAMSADGPVNTDGDRAAAVVANSLQAETLLLLTNVDGVLDDEGNVVERIERSEVEAYIGRISGTRSGGMRKKLLACQEAEVPVGIGNGLDPASVLAGGGTWVR